MEVGLERKARGIARCVPIASFYDHITVSYQYGEGQMKLIPSNGVSVTMKHFEQLSKLKSVPKTFSLENWK